MGNWRRILAAVGTTALLISNVGAVTQTAFASEQTATETVPTDTGETHTEGGTVTEPQNPTDPQPDPTPEGSTPQDDTKTGDATQPPSTPGGSTSGENQGGTSEGGTSQTNTDAGQKDNTGEGTENTGKDGTDISQGQTDTGKGSTGTDGNTGTGDAGKGSTGTDGNTGTGDTGNGTAGEAGDTTGNGTTPGNTAVPKTVTTDETVKYENDDANGLKVTAVTTDDAIPEGYELKVTEITDEEQRSKIAEQLIASDNVGEFDGFVAYDVGFVNANDHEAEPKKGTSVDVTFQFDENTLPAGVDTSTLEIQHIDESGEETKVVTVADTTDGKVKVASTSNEETTPAVTAEFQLESFSILVETFLFGDGTSFASISGGPTVTVGNTIRLACDRCRYGQYSYGTRTWTSSDTSIAAFSSGSTTSQPSLKGVARGTVKITHTHADRNGDTETSTYEVTVMGSGDRTAATYALKTPGSQPGSNDSGDWTDVIGNSIVNVPTNTNQSPWVPVYNDWGWVTNHNITDNVSSYIVSWPDGSAGGGDWVLNADTDSNSYFNKILNMIFDAYSKELGEELGITDLQKSNIKTLTLTPYKISYNSGDVHVDCVISIKCEKAYTVQFSIKEVGASSYNLVYKDSTYNMHIVDSHGKAPETELDPIAELNTQYSGGFKVGDTKVVNGVTYRLSGWYTEDETTHGARSDTIADFSGKGYVPNYEKQLKDNEIVDLYAEWVPVTGDLKVTKNVDATSGFYDPDAKYQIKIHLDNAANKTYGDYVFDSNGDYIVTLEHGETVTIPEINSGTKYTVEEVATSAQGFQVSYNETFYKLDDAGNKETIKDATAGTIYPDGIAEVTVKNEMKVVLTGVRTTEAPTAAMIATIAMVIIGTTAYYKAKRYMH